MTEKIVHWQITGRVQGVAYRASAANEAVRLGVKGWVRNRLDGSVELKAQGSQEQLADLRQWCLEGPTYARVQAVEDIDQIAPDILERFEILATE